MFTHFLAALLAFLPASSPAPLAGGWEVRRLADRCLLLRQSDLPENALLFIERTPGTDGTSVNFRNPGWSKAPHRPGDLELVLEPSGPEQARAYFTPRYDFPPQLPIDAFKMSLNVKDRGFAKRLASASAVSVRGGKREIARSSLPSIGPALESLRACEHGMLRSWGIDPVEWEALASAPVPKANLASFVSDQDFPPEAARKGASGRSIVRLQVSAAGRVERCETAVSSGHSALDAKTCSIALRRARFEPARDRDGQPIAAPFVTSIAWHMYP